jgi:DNA primase
VIPPSFIQELLARADIVALVGRHVELKKTGANHSGLCPFHGEKTPSFTVSPSKQFYHCFGCGAHGNAIGFLMEHAGLGFVEAVHELAGEIGMAVPEDQRSPDERERARVAKERQATLGDVLAKAAAHYRKQLKASPRAIDYLKGRGLTGEVAARFGLGYSPDGWRPLASAFAEYDDPLLEEAGLVIARDDGDGGDGRRYDRFRDRVMFPIRGVQGDVIGFGGRVLDRGEPKYLNSPETPLFVKGRELYGLFEARSALRERGYVLVVEGYMDVVALAQWGFANAVATLGTACTPEHVAKLFRFTDSVVFAFDGDAAGRRAAGRALEASLPHAGDTRSVRFLFLPPEHDPDSYVRERGAEAFERQIADAVPLSRQLLAHAADGCDAATAEGRARALAQARPLWSALPDEMLKRQLLGELAGMVGLDAGELGRLWQPRHAPARTTAGEARRSARFGQARPGATTLVERALWLLLTRCELWNGLPTRSQDLLAEQPEPYGPMFSLLERSLHEHGPQTASTLLGLLGDADLGAAAPQVLARVGRLHELADEHDPARELELTLHRLHLQAIEDELTAMFEAGVASGDAEQRGRMLLGERSRLKQMLSRPPADPGRSAAAEGRSLTGNSP